MRECLVTPFALSHELADAREPIRANAFGTISLGTFLSCCRLSASRRPSTASTHCLSFMPPGRRAGSISAPMLEHSFPLRATPIPAPGKSQRNHYPAIPAGPRGALHDQAMQCDFPHWSCDGHSHRAYPGVIRSEGGVIPTIPIAAGRSSCPVRKPS